MFTAKTTNIVEGKDAERFILDAISFVAEDLHINPKQAKRIYYEVCRRFKLPTLTKNPFPGTYLRTEF